MALQSNGDIVVAGGYIYEWQPDCLGQVHFDRGARYHLRVGRHGQHGPARPSSHVYGVELQSDGSIVVGAQFFPASGPRSMALIRYTSSGKLDTSFANNGIATFTIGGQSTYLNDIIVDANDNIVVAGDCDGDLVVARFTPDGALDTTFGSGGYISGSYGSMRMLGRFAGQRPDRDLGRCLQRQFARCPFRLERRVGHDFWPQRTGLRRQFALLSGGNSTLGAHSIHRPDRGRRVERHRERRHPVYLQRHPRPDFLTIRERLRTGSALSPGKQIAGEP